MATKTEDGKIVYTDKERGLIIERIRELRMTGYSQQAFNMRDRFNAGQEIYASEYIRNRVNPEKPQTIDIALAEMEVPRRDGPGSSTARWRNFAKATAIIEDDVIDSLPRADIIMLLEEKGIIEKESGK